METQLFCFADWQNSNIIYNKKCYILNPYNKQDLSGLTLDDFETINTDCVYFEGGEFQKIQKVQKAAHHRHSDDIFNLLTVAFSAKLNSAPHKFYFVREKYAKLEQLFISYKEGDIPANEMYNTTILDFELTGCQIHKIRFALKERFQNGKLTYDHIYPDECPLARYNSKNIFVITDAFGKFFYWLQDLHKIFEKSHLEICAAAHFNPDNPGLEDYLNFIEAYYNENLYAIVQAALVATCKFKNLHLDNTYINQFHPDYIAKKLRKLRMFIDTKFLNTPAANRSEFITPVFLKLKQILNKAKKRFNEHQDNTILKYAFNTDKAVYELLESRIIDIEEFYFDSIEKKSVVTSTPFREDFNFSPPVNALIYKNWAKDGGAINGLYQSMKLAGEINKDTDYEDFKNAFLNKPVKNKIALNLSKSAAFYFFRELKNKLKIEDNHIWSGVSNAFYISADKDYDMIRLSFQKGPKDKKVRERINTLVNSL